MLCSTKMNKTLIAPGVLLTFVQFIIVLAMTLPSQLERVSTRTQPSPGATRLRFKKPQLPFARVAVMSSMFFVVNMMNNWAFAFDISVPLHIILRSFGSVTTLFMGWLHGKKYSRVQVLSVLALTVGVVVSAWADAVSKVCFEVPSEVTYKQQLTLQQGKSTSLTTSKPASNFLPGLAILFLAQSISAYMGVYTEATYAAHGRHWRETLFYSHLFGLVFSLALFPTLLNQTRKLGAATAAARFDPLALALALPDSIRGDRTVLKTLQLLGGILAHVPLAPALVLTNALTQVACISGVNRLSAQTGAVTVTVVLNVRKLASFLLSCLVFGNQLSGMMMVGSAIVFASGAVYGWDSGRGKKKAAADGKVEDKKSQ